MRSCADTIRHTTAQPDTTDGRMVWMDGFCLSAELRARIGRISRVYARSFGARERTRVIIVRARLAVDAVCWSVREKKYIHKSARVRTFFVARASLARRRATSIQQLRAWCVCTLPAHGTQHIHIYISHVHTRVHRQQHRVYTINS